MVVPHYTYLVLKMLTEQGVLSLRANLNITYSCEKESFALIKATYISIRMVSPQQIFPEDLEIPTMEVARASTKSKQVKKLLGSGPTLIPNRKTCSSAS
jgi:hypothetical protein